MKIKYNQNQKNKLCEYFNKYYKKFRNSILFYTILVSAVLLFAAIKISNYISFLIIIPILLAFIFIKQMLVIKNCIKDNNYVVYRGECLNIIRDLENDMIYYIELEGLNRKVEYNYDLEEFNVGDEIDLIEFLNDNNDIVYNPVSKMYERLIIKSIK